MSPTYQAGRQAPTPGELLGSFIAQLDPQREQEREPFDHDWLETGPISELVAWIDIEKLLGQRH